MTIQTNKNYTFLLNIKNLETLRKLGKPIDRKLSWLIRSLIKYGIDNWTNIKEKL